MHCTDVRFDEARNHGAGFYKLRKDEEKRNQEQNTLRKTHEETNEMRKQRKKKNEMERQKNSAMRVASSTARDWDREKEVQEDDL